MKKRNLYSRTRFRNSRKNIRKNSRGENGINRKNAKTRRIRGGSVFKYLFGSTADAAGTADDAEPKYTMIPDGPQQLEMVNGMRCIEYGNNKSGRYTGHIYNKDGRIFRHDLNGFMAYDNGNRHIGSFVDDRISGKGTYIKGSMQWIGNWKHTDKGPESDGTVIQLTYHKKRLPDIKTTTYLQPTQQDLKDMQAATNASWSGDGSTWFPPTHPPPTPPPPNAAPTSPKATPASPKATPASPKSKSPKATPASPKSKSPTSPTSNTQKVPLLKAPPRNKFVDKR